MTKWNITRVREPLKNDAKELQKISQKLYEKSKGKNANNFISSFNKRFREKGGSSFTYNLLIHSKYGMYILEN